MGYRNWVSFLSLIASLPAKIGLTFTLNQPSSPNLAFFFQFPHGSNWYRHLPFNAFLSPFALYPISHQDTGSTFKNSLMCLLLPTPLLIKANSILPWVPEREREREWTILSVSTVNPSLLIFYTFWLNELIIIIFLIFEPLQLHKQYR